MRLVVAHLEQPIVEVAVGGVLGSPVVPKARMAGERPCVCHNQTCLEYLLDGQVRIVHWLLGATDSVPVLRQLPRHERDLIHVGGSGVHLPKGPESLKELEELVKCSDDRRVCVVADFDEKIEAGTSGAKRVRPRVVAEPINRGHAGVSETPANLTLVDLLLGEFGEPLRKLDQRQATTASTHRRIFA
jgi:hypothetical protein